MHATFDSLFGTPEGRLDPEEMFEAMIKIVSDDKGEFRNVVLNFVENRLKDHQ